MKTRLDRIMVIAFTLGAFGYMSMPLAGAPKVSISEGSSNIGIAGGNAKIESVAGTTKVGGKGVAVGEADEGSGASPQPMAASPAASSGAGKVEAPGAGVVSAVPQAVPAEVIPEEVVDKPTKGGCCSPSSLENNPCAQKMIEKPCKDLMIAERLVCIKQEKAKCMAKKKEIMKENHPCAASIVGRPCKDVADEMARAKCIDKEISDCKSKWAGTYGK